MRFEVDDIQIQLSGGRDKLHPLDNECVCVCVCVCPQVCVAYVAPKFKDKFQVYLSIELNPSHLFSFDYY